MTFRYTTPTQWCPCCGGVLYESRLNEAVCMRRVEAGGCGAHYTRNAGGRWVRACTAEHRRGGSSCSRSTG
jgi:hypothetical protein